MTPAPHDDAAPPSARCGEVFRVFLRLGLTSFGGPIAHLAYFRDAFVVRRRWLDEATFAQLLALCQFLPGPASSQLGFALGLRRAGWAGALCAFAGFTLPSALLMFAIARVMRRLLATGTGVAVVHGLKLVAVVVVAHGLWGMARTLAPDLRRIGIAVMCAALVLTFAHPWMQLAAIALGAALGALACRRLGDDREASVAPLAAVSARSGIAAGVAFLAGLAWCLWPRDGALTLDALAAAHYQAGALVFGGGHVVLPLLEAQLVAPGWLGAPDFLAGYGAAQAVPGPMFTLATYLGASVHTGAPATLGAAIATLAVFLPGFLLLVAALPAWSSLAHRRGLAAAMAGVGAAVVGVLAAALYDPLWTQGVSDARDIAVVAGGLLLCALLRRPILGVLPWCVGTSLLWARLG